MRKENKQKEIVLPSEKVKKKCGINPKTSDVSKELRRTATTGRDRYLFLFFFMYIYIYVLFSLISYKPRIRNELSTNEETRGKPFVDS